MNHRRPVAEPATAGGQAVGNELPEVCSIWFRAWRTDGEYGRYWGHKCKSKKRGKRRGEKKEKSSKLAPGR